MKMKKTQDCCEHAGASSRSNRDWPMRSIPDCLAETSRPEDKNYNPIYTDETSGWHQSLNQPCKNIQTELCLKSKDSSENNNAKMWWQQPSSAPTPPQRLLKFSWNKPPAADYGPGVSTNRASLYRRLATQQQKHQHWRSIFEVRQRQKCWSRVWEEKLPGRAGTSERLSSIQHPGMELGHADLLPRVVLICWDKHFQRTSFSLRYELIYQTTATMSSVTDTRDPWT